MNNQQLKDFIVAELTNKKAENIKALNVEDSGIATYMVFASGRSSKNVSALADNLSLAIKDATGFKVTLEGLRSGTWAILDVEGVVVHIFHPETREYYNVEQIFEPSNLPSIAA